MRKGETFTNTYFLEHDVAYKRYPLGSKHEIDGYKVEVINHKNSSKLKSNGQETNITLPCVEFKVLSRLKEYSTKDLKKFTNKLLKTNSNFRDKLVYMLFDSINSEKALTEDDIVKLLSKEKIEAHNIKPRVLSISYITQDGLEHKYSEIAESAQLALEKIESFEVNISKFSNKNKKQIKDFFEVYDEYLVVMLDSSNKDIYKVKVELSMVENKITQLEEYLEEITGDVNYVIGKLSKYS